MCTVYNLWTNPKKTQNKCKQTYANISFDVPMKHDKQEKSRSWKLQNLLKQTLHGICHIVSVFLYLRISKYFRDTINSIQFITLYHISSKSLEQKWKLEVIQD